MWTERHLAGIAAAFRHALSPMSFLLLSLLMLLLLASLLILLCLYYRCRW